MSIDIEEIDCDTCLIMQKIVSDEIDDEELYDFAIDNLEELLSYIINGNLNIRIYRDITGEMWFGWGRNESKKINRGLTSIMTSLYVKIQSHTPYSLTYRISIRK